MHQVVAGCGCPLATGDRVVITVGAGGGFFWPRVPPGSTGIVAELTADHARVFVPRADRSVWAPVSQVALYEVVTAGEAAARTGQ